MNALLRALLICILLGESVDTFMTPVTGQEHPAHQAMSVNDAESFASLALKGIAQEYPNKPSNVMQSQADVRSPQQMHPSFYGSFDWHSSVHGHWMLVRLLRLYPTNAFAAEIRTTLNQQLTEERMTAEARYFESDHNKHFERMYGWAWLLQLVRELHAWEDTDAQQWRTNLRPLETIIVRRIHEYLPKLSFPIRVGTHTDTAFALAMELDYARVIGSQDLESLIVQKARDFYLDDQLYPAHYEPSGHDFFSPGFNEADLMRRVLSREEFGEWLNQFLPGLKNGALGNMMEPVEVTDVTDGHLVHLAGLDLSRAWTMDGISLALPGRDPRRSVLSASVLQHRTEGLKYVHSGHYEGEHWLATFAVYHLTRSGTEVPAIPVTKQGDKVRR